jgi:excinuclease ABC subunit A
MDEAQVISIRGARQHNLKNINLEIPRNKLIVVTGLSGSGKSSLAFDTIFAEGQRRYVESLSPYARQFLGQMEKPDVDHIEGLPPTIAIEQRAGIASPRSTVATTTEIYDFMRLLYARTGEPHCYRCGRAISQQTAEQIVRSVLSTRPGTRIMVMAPLVKGRKGEHRQVLDRVRQEGFVRVRVDGIVADLRDVGTLDKNKKHEIEAVVDRLVVNPGIETRLTESVETALKLGEGLMIVAAETGARWVDTLYSELFACAHCGISFPEMQPNMFSFNSPYGACPACDGLGTKLEFDPDLIVPDRHLTLSAGAVDVWRHAGHRIAIYFHYVIREFCQQFDVDPDIPFDQVDEEKRYILLHGTDSRTEAKYGHSFEGVVPNCERRFAKSTSEYVKNKLLEYMSELPCVKCGGARLRPEARAVLVGGKPIHEITRMSVVEGLRFFNELKLNEEQQKIARQILKEICSRMGFMADVGIGYLTLDRRTSSLAGGEAQRIRLATQVGSGLVGICYVLDEPSIGLHMRDNRKLIDTLIHLRDMGNTVVVVEHDEETIRSADHIIDLGPGAGAHGGNIVAQGGLDAILSHPRSLTGSYLGGRLAIGIPEKRRPYELSRAIEVRGAKENNLKNVNVKFPLGVFICVTGVSGSGKSTLVTQTLCRALGRQLHHAREKPGEHEKVLGAKQIDKVIEIDQSPIGRTPRSNPATYTKAFDPIRQLFAMSREAKIRGYGPGRFSFNVKGGRCEACQGQGLKLIEMHFLPDVYVMCQECNGKRYNRETLEVKFKGLSIAEVLDLSVEEALKVFDRMPHINNILQTLSDVGLGYIKLGQSSTQLSGGEAQRVKLGSELGRRATGQTFYILDEPTTGLHFHDISKLLHVLSRLTDKGNTVVVIEHNPDVIKYADYIIDLGPEGGEEGGRVIATGTPEEVAENVDSYTGQYLKKYLAETRERMGGTL